MPFRKMTFHDKIIMLLFYSDLHATRFTLAVAEMIWAISLLFSGNTFERQTYTVMANVMSEEAWGFIFLITSLLQFSILMRGEYHDKHACYFAAWNCALWLFVVTSIYMSISPLPAAISGEAALTLAAGWVWVRSGYPCIGRRSTDYELRITKKEILRG